VKSQISVSPPMDSCQEKMTTSKADEVRTPPSDGGSTRAPSAQTTPESGPGQPPIDLDMEEPLNLGNVLVEVFGNGMQHAIGTDGDPDDVHPNLSSRTVLPLQVLQLLAAASWQPHGSRRRRADDDDDDDDDDDADDDDGDDDDDDDDDEDDDNSEQEDGDDMDEDVDNQDDEQEIYGEDEDMIESEMDEDGEVMNVGSETPDQLATASI